MITWITGNTGSGKTTRAQEMRIKATGPTVILDGDELREIWPGLGFNRGDRWIQNLRAARLAKALETQGFDVIVATICPYKELRDEVLKITGCEFIYLEGGKQGEDYPYER